MFLCELCVFAVNIVLMDEFNERLSGLTA